MKNITLTNSLFTTFYKLIIISLFIFIANVTFAQTFTAADITGDTGNSFDVVTGDVNGDGYLDIYVTNYNQQNKLWINDGAGNFTAMDISGDLGESYGVTMGDVNGDTYLDIYVANGGTEQNKLWINDGAGNFTAMDISGDFGNSRLATMGDVNGDTYLDIYVTNYTGQNRLWINDGAGNFTANDISGDTDFSSGGTMGDVNGDTYLDIYVFNKPGQNKLWINDGSGNFTAMDISGDFGNSSYAEMGDVNGDTYLDIYVANGGTEQNKLWINDGAGNFTANDISGDLNDSYGATMNDVNGDTYLDIYVTNYAGQNRLWINDGAGNFTANDISGDVGGSIKSAVGDFNDDGLLDIYVTKYGEQNSLWIQDGNFTAGDGSQEDPYQITNCIELQSMEDELSAHYKLINDIECADSATWNSGKGFAPVGTAGDPFTGSFNGQNFEIRDLYIERANDIEGEDPMDEDYVALFGHTEGATTTNLSMVDIYVKGYRYVGGVIGYMDGGLIENISVNWAADVDEDNDCLSPKICIWARWGQHGGGVVGYASEATISHIQSGGAVKGSGSNIGGVIGSAYDSTISLASSTARVDGGQQIGGLIGYMSGGSLTYGTASGYVDGTSDGEEAKYNQSENIGGLLGQGENSSITLSFATGNVLGRANVGGFIGLGNQMIITDAYASGDAMFASSPNYHGGFAGYLLGNSLLTNVYARGNVSAPALFGGLVAAVNNATANNSFWDTETSGTETSATGQGVLTAAMKTMSTFTDTGWDFTTIWDINPLLNAGYPFLRFQGLSVPVSLVSTSKTSGTSAGGRAKKLIERGETEKAKKLIKQFPNSFTDKQILSSHQKQLADLIAQYKALTGQDPVFTTSDNNPSLTLGTRNLDLSDTGTDVELLQRFLLAKGYSIPAGATGYFGNQTKAALAQFQTTTTITPAVGYYGPLTRATIKRLYPEVVWR